MHTHAPPPAPTTTRDLSINGGAGGLIHPVTTYGLNPVARGALMRIDAATAFSLDDLAVFGGAHLRQVIGEVSGLSSGLLACLNRTPRLPPCLLPRRA
jgi:hypothetical protein